MAKNIEIEKMSFAKDMPLPSYSSDNCSGLDLYAANKKNLILKNAFLILKNEVFVCHFFLRGFFFAGKNFLPTKTFCEQTKFTRQKNFRAKI